MVLVLVAVKEAGKKGGEKHNETLERNTLYSEEIYLFIYLLNYLLDFLH